MKKPVIAITMGDPSGVGPEITAMAVADSAVRRICRPWVIGDLETLRRAAAIHNSTGQVTFVPVSSVKEIADDAVVPVLDLANVDAASFSFGNVRVEYGKAVGEYIEAAVRLVSEGSAAAVVTAPIHKESFRLAGYPYPGHTEMLTALTQSPHVSLMLMHGDFRVVHATNHIALSDAVGQIKFDKVLQVIRTAHQGCLDLGIQRPRIAVAGLNPHAGDGGLFGHEDADEIKPAVGAAAALGIDVQGPFPPDTVFPMMRGKKFDIVVCQYHDQGGIPLKLLSFDWDESAGRWKEVRGVNVSLGLSIIRTSVAHGTGFEIAGKGLASHQSLVDAVVVAERMIDAKKTLQS